MRNLRYVLFFALLCGAKCWGVDQEFYRAFLSAVDTNELGAIPIKSPLLVDTNNMAPKLTNVVLSLKHCKASGQLGPVRLGMTMEEVVGCWGKPRYFWSRCFGGPRFCYADINVVFEPASNSVRSIICFGKDLPRFDNGLSSSSNMEDFIRVLGAPTNRKNRGDDFAELFYDAPATHMRLDFYEGSLSSVRLDPPVRAESTK
jgi:hypothetical protein